MNPPTTSSGQPLRLYCVRCGKSALSTELLCDLDGKPWTYYCPGCADQLRNSNNEAFPSADFIKR